MGLRKTGRGACLPLGESRPRPSPEGAFTPPLPAASSIDEREGEEDGVRWAFVGVRESPETLSVRGPNDVVALRVPASMLPREGLRLELRTIGLINGADASDDGTIGSVGVSEVGCIIESDSTRFQ